MYRPFQYLLVFVFAIIGASLSAQFKSNPLDTIQQDTVKIEIDSSDTALMDSLYDVRNKGLFDSTKVRYYYWYARNESMPLDTTLASMEKVPVLWDKAKHLENQPFLSNFGNALLPITYKARLRQGFYVGYETPLLYQLNLERMPLYAVEKNTPFTDIYYAQINQRNTTVRATISHQITPKLYYSLHYGLLNSMGFYDQQGVRNQNIGLLLRYRNKRNETLAAFFTQAYSGLENGGVQVDSSVNNVSNKLLGSVLMNLTDAAFKYNATHINFSQYWYNRAFVENNPNKDSAQLQSIANFAWGYEFAMEDNVYKYYDNAPNSYYYGANFAVNPRGLRQYIEHTEYKLGAGIRYAFGNGLVQDVQTQPAIVPLLLEAQAFYKLHNFRHEPLIRTYISNYGVKAKLSFNTAKNYEDLNFVKGDIAAQALYNENSLDAYVDGKVDIALGKWFKLQGEALLQTAEVSQLARRVFVSHQAIWNNDNMKQQQDIALGARLAIPRLGMSFALNNQTINNLVYSNENRIMQQATDQAVNILSLSARQDWKLGGWGISGEITYQKVLAGEQYMPLPQLHLKYSAFWEGKVFKSLFLRTGANVHYWSAFQAQGYFPLTQQFYLQNAQNIQIYPRIDYFIAFRLYQARIFVNAENVMNIFKKENYFTAMHYATPNFLIRFGVSWRMFN